MNKMVLSNHLPLSPSTQQVTHQEASTQRGEAINVYVKANEGAENVNFNGVIENQVEGVFNISNKGALRQEVEISLTKPNGEQFKGMITPHEAEHKICKNALVLLTSSTI